MQLLSWDRFLRFSFCFLFFLHAFYENINVTNTLPPPIALLAIDYFWGV